jgi:hypothetical protein
VTILRIDLDHPDQYTSEWLRADIRNIIRTLRDAGCDPVERKPGVWLSLCPMHDDSRPSLQVSRGTSVPWVAHCFACSGEYADLVMHLEQRFERTRWIAARTGGRNADRPVGGCGRPVGAGNGAGVPNPQASALRGVAGSTAVGDTASNDSNSASGTSGTSTITRFTTRLADGRTFDHVRTSVDGKKVGGMPWDPPLGASGVKVRDLPLYGWERLAERPDALVVVCEGEHAATELQRALPDVVCVATVCGASTTPSDDVLRVLLSRQVVTWEDADPPGERHMATIVHALRRLGHRSVRRIRYGADKDDAADAVARSVDVARLMVEATEWPEIRDASMDKALDAERRRRAVKRTIDAEEQTDETATIADSLLYARASVDLPRPSWLIDSIVARGQVAGVYGAAGSLKSFVVLDICLSTLFGAPTLGNDVYAEDAVCLYWAAEGAMGTSGRIESWLVHRGMTPDDLTDRWVVGTEPPNLSSPAGCQAFYDAVKTVYVRHGRLTLWALDTVSACIPGADENNEAMSRITDVAKAICRDFDCSGILVHHSGKDDSRGPRGGSAFGANIDAVFHAVAQEIPPSIRTESGGVILQLATPVSKISCEKQRNAMQRAPFAVTLSPVADLPDPVIVLSDRPVSGTPHDPDLPGRRRLPEFLRWLAKNPGVIPNHLPRAFGGSKTLTVTLVRLAVDEGEAHLHEFAEGKHRGRRLYPGPVEQGGLCHDGAIVE